MAQKADKLDALLEAVEDSREAWDVAVTAERAAARTHELAIRRANKAGISYREIARADGVSHQQIQWTLYPHDRPLSR